MPPHQGPLLWCQPTPAGWSGGRALLKGDLFREEWPRTCELETPKTGSRLKDTTAVKVTGESHSSAQGQEIQG